MDIQDVALALEQEKSLRISLENECNRLKILLSTVEAQLQAKCQENFESKKEYEVKLCNVYMRIGKYKTGEVHYHKEIEGLKQALGNAKSDFFTATDESISKATQIDGLYSIISQHQKEISSLRSEISEYQMEYSKLEKDNQLLLKALEKKNNEKVVKTEYIRQSCSECFSPLVPPSNRFSPNKSQSLTSHALAKAKSQMFLLKKSKDRLDLQMNLLSSLSSIN